MAFKDFMKETDGDVELSLKLTGIFMNSFLSSIMDGARNSKEETKLVNDKLSEFLS